MGLYEYNEKELIMMFHTALRNVGLYTSISFALLGISRFYRTNKKIYIYNIGFISLSILFLSIAIYLSNNLINDITLLLNNIEDSEKSILHKWLLVPNVLFYMDIILLLFTVYTLYRQF
jgi:hypothetical protein